MIHIVFSLLVLFAIPSWAAEPRSALELIQSLKADFVNVQDRTHDQQVIAICAAVKEKVNIRPIGKYAGRSLVILEQFTSQELEDLIQLVPSLITGMLLAKLELIRAEDIHINTKVIERNDFTLVNAMLQAADNNDYQFQFSVIKNDAGKFVIDDLKIVSLFSIRDGLRSLLGDNTNSKK